MSNHDDIERWLDDCDEVKNIDARRGGPGYSKWELDFLDSVREQFEENGGLSKKQVGILRGLWDRI